MGFLDGLKGLFKGKGVDSAEPKKEVVPDAVEPAILPAKRPIGELQLPERVEACEEPRVIVCPQLQYGKIYHPDGSAITSKRAGGMRDRHFTGASADFSASLLHELEIDRLFEGAQNFLPGSGHHSSKYPWKEAGGILVKRAIEHEGRRCVVCGLHKFFPDSGVAGVGRDFRQMNAVVIPAEEWSLGIVPQLLDKLNPKPMMRDDPYELSDIEISTDVLDRPLPESWFSDEVRELLEHILSGRSLCVQSLSNSEKGFVNCLYFALLCLPEKIARRVSFGAGLPQLKDGNLRIGHAMAASNHEGFRKVGENWKNSYARFSDGKMKEIEADPLDIAFVSEYMTALNALIGDCKTPRDVMKAVGKWIQVW